MTPRVEEERIREFSHLFDADGSGSYDHEEIALALKVLGFTDVPHDELERLIFDVGGEGCQTIGYPEFEKIMKQQLQVRDSFAEVRRAFRLFDLEGKGRITVDNLRDLAAMLGESPTSDLLNDMIAWADEDQDKAITFKEFKRIMYAMEGK